MTDNILFLDLEETIISEFYNGFLLPMNISSIKKHIVSNNYDDFGIFSAALWYNTEKDEFRSEWLTYLEDKLGVCFNLSVSPTIDSLMKMYCDKHRISHSMYTMSDFFESHGKEESFQLFSERWNNCNLTLIDDSVRNISINYKDSNVVLEMINIDDMRNKL